MSIAPGELYIDELYENGMLFKRYLPLSFGIRIRCIRTDIASHFKTRRPLVKSTKHGQVCLALPSRLFVLDLAVHMDVLRNPGPTSGVCYQSEYQRYLQSSSSSTIIKARSC